jgi:hypothetical protein
MPTTDFLRWWEHFSNTGDICPARLGMSREELGALSGAPDAIGGTSRGNPAPAIWRYGDLEFHFGLGESDQLFLIYLEQEGAVSVSIPRNPGPPPTS